MTRNKLLVALSFFLLFFTACTKEKSFEYSPGGGNNNTNDIIGTYDFIDLYVKGTSDLELVDGGVKINTITYTEYRTINNAGLVTITKDVITYKELTYAV